MDKRISILVATLLIGGCATPYQSSGLTGGFEGRLVSQSPLMYEVRFLGNGTTSASRARDFVLLRGAELMLAAGREQFVVTNNGRGYGSDKWFEGAENQGTIFNPRRTVTVKEASAGMGMKACEVVRDVVGIHSIKRSQLERTTTMACGTSEKV